MANKAINVFSTNVSSENMSRYQLIQWVNERLGTNFEEIEQLSTGIPYCKLMHQLFPSAVPLQRLKTAVQSEYAFIENFKILQIAFKKTGVNMVIPIEKLVKGRFQDNLEFLQYFRKFYDMNRGEAASAASTAGPNKQQSSVTLDADSRRGTAPAPLNKRLASSARCPRIKAPCAEVTSPGRTTDELPAGNTVQMISAQANQIDLLKAEVQLAKKERSGYLDGMRKIAGLTSSGIDPKQALLEISHIVKNALKDAQIPPGEALSADRRH